MSIKGRRMRPVSIMVSQYSCCDAIIKDRFPDRLIICQVITTEKIILEQFRGGQADSKRVPENRIFAVHHRSQLPVDPRTK